MSYDRTNESRGAYEAAPGDVGRVLLLYSGGLDTSVMLKWIQDEYEAEVVALCVNLGQPDEDFEVIKGKATGPGRAGLRGDRRARGVRPRLRAAGHQGERPLRRRLSAVHRAGPAADRQARRREGARARLRRHRPRLHRQGQRPGAHRRHGARPGARPEDRRARAQLEDGPRRGDRLRARARHPREGRQRGHAVFDRRQHLGPVVGGRADRGPLRAAARRRVRAGDRPSRRSRRAPGPRGRASSAASPSRSTARSSGSWS